MSDDICIGQLKGDPDIAGIGVVSAVFTTTALAILCSGILWNIIYRQDLPNPLTTPLPRGYAIAQKCTSMFADIQLGTALAITCASLVQIKSAEPTSLYHLFIARGLAQANLAGHGAGLLLDMRKQVNWTLRIWLLAVALGLYFYWTVLAIHEFWHGWDDVTPWCFHNTNVVPGDYDHWMVADIVWTSLGYLWTFVAATGQFPELLKVLDDDTAWLWTSSVQDVAALRRTYRTRGFGAAWGSLQLAVLKILLLLVVGLVITPPCTSPFAAMFFLSWPMYDVYTARAANRPILVLLPNHNRFQTSLQGNSNPEDDWGFGQLLPFFLLFLPLLQVLDAIVEGTKPGQEVSLRELVRKLFRT